MRRIRALLTLEAAVPADGHEVQEQLPGGKGLHAAEGCSGGSGGSDVDFFGERMCGSVLRTL